MKINTDIFKIQSNNESLATGKLLLSEPFLVDNIFERSVILMIEHTPQGSMGIVLNKPMPVMVNEFVEEFNELGDIPLFKGGPVGEDILFYLHTFGDVPGAFSIAEGLYLNGDFNTIKQYLLEGDKKLDTIRFFLGYAGWSDEQLRSEIAENTWIIGKADLSLIQQQDTRNMWRRCMEKLGGKYRAWARFPLYPVLN